MSLSSSRRSHWLVAASCVAAVSLATAAAVYREPAKSPPIAATSTSGPKVTTSGGEAAGAAQNGQSPVAGSGSPSSSSGVHKINFGLAYGATLIAESDAALASSLNDAVAVGAKWIRVDLPWDAIQPASPTQYDWQKFDRVVTATSVRGLKIDAVLNDPPYWARQSVCKNLQSCPPADFTAYAHFASVAATRYAPRGVHTWEIWNEPNIGAWAPKPDPAAYEKLLVLAAKALHAADRHAFVILGGMAAVATNPSLNYLSTFSFLSTVASLGGTRYIDAVGFHPYSLPVAPASAPNFQTISSARDNLVGVLQQYGTPNVPIWLTETGAQVNFGVANLPPAQVATASALQAQATYATQLVAYVKGNQNVAADFWYSDQDDPSAALYFGLRGADGKARPSFTAFRDAIASCGCNND